MGSSCLLTLWGLRTLSRPVLLFCPFSWVHEMRGLDPQHYLNNKKISARVLGMCLIPERNKVHKVSSR